MSKIRDIIEQERAPLTGRNRLINGGFDIWQRGTSFPFAAGAGYTYTVDRFNTANRSDGQFTAAKSTMGNKTALRYTVDTAVTDLTLSNYWHVASSAQEGSTLYDLAVNGKDITVSFWFNSNVVGEYPVALRNATGAVTTDWDSYVATFNYTTANTPQKVEITIPLSTTWSVAPLNDSNRGFSIIIGFLNQGAFVAASNNTWLNGANAITSSAAVNWGATAGNFIEIAELQLEEGTVATPFERQDVGTTLAQCQRYYEFINTKGVAVTYHALYARYQELVFNAPKRAVPTVTITNPTAIGHTGTQGTIYSLGTYPDRLALIYNWTDGIVGSAFTITYSVEVDAEL